MKKVNNRKIDSDNNSRIKLKVINDIIGNVIMVIIITIIIN